MKKVIAMSVALSLSLGVASPLVSSTSPSKVEAAGYSFTTEQTNALNHINKIRQNLGLNPVALNPFLNKAAENHANYLVLNNITGHFQTPGKKGFTGETLDDRLRAVGAPSNIIGSAWEGVAPQKTSIASAIDAFMASAYHREPLVLPNVTDIGVAIKDGKVVVNYYQNTDIKSDKESVYPFNGQTNLGTVFYGKSEDPNPLAKFKVEKSGFIISYTQHYYFMDELNYFTLKDSKGVNVPVFQENNFGTWFFYPKAELKKGEKYTASISYPGVTYDDNGNEIVKQMSKTWSFTTGGTSTPTPPPPVVTPPTKVVYADFKTGQYWSLPFLWAIDKGLISGYTNVKNPKTGKLENLLKPMDNLTEAQFLSVMFRYTNKDELTKTKPKVPSYWASTAYQLAEKYKLPTNATLTNRAKANLPITRGKMAQILASKHYGKPVTQQVAVQFMYDAGLSTGYVDKNGKTPKTYASYGVNDILKRGQIATFMQNYDRYLNKK